MVLIPNNWADKDKVAFASRISSHFSESGTEEWIDSYNRLLRTEWPQLWELALEVCPDLVEPLLSQESLESQQGSY